MRLRGWGEEGGAQALRHRASMLDTRWNSVRVLSRPHLEKNP